MNEAANIQEDQGHRVDPPIVDFLAYDPQLGAYMAEFVPDEKVSTALKESVQIGNESAIARRVGELLEALGEHLQVDSPITTIAHAGGDSFDIDLADGSTISLRESKPIVQAFDLYAILQVLAQEIQLEFIVQTRPARRAAG